MISLSRLRHSLTSSAIGCLLPNVVSRRQRKQVAAILQRRSSEIVKDWLEKVKKSKELNDVSLSDQDRTGYLPRLIEDLILRLRSTNVPGVGERFHLFRRRRCLRPDAKVTGLHFCHVGARLSNPSSNSVRDVAEESECLDFSSLLPDVMTIADEVDSQLTQAMEGYASAEGATTTAAS